MSWDLLQDGKTLAIEWKETRDRPVGSPRRQGFGTNLIRSVVEQQLRGTVSSRWEANGLRCSISLPMGGIAPD